VTLIDQKSTVKSIEKLNCKNMGVLDCLMKKFVALMAGKFTGQIIINMSQGGITKIYKHEEVNLNKN